MTDIQMKGAQTGRLDQVLAAIDAANAADPTQEDGRPAAALYGERMSAELARLCPDADEVLQIAARGQHIERWTSPRKSYPEGRAGYLRWRNDLKVFHARRLGDIMADAGYSQNDIDRVGALVRKERLRTDAEAQSLEDVVCLVFLKHYVGDFASKVDETKLGDILAKTWRKISEAGQKHALGLDLPPSIPKLLEAGLARLEQARSSSS